MYQRAITSELMTLSEDYPVVTIIGPRQSGKTFLARQTFENKPYINLEAPDIRARAESDPKGLFDGLPDGAVFAEILRAPQLLSYIQTIVDEQPIKGQFILTASHQLKLHEAISQSLAGRTAMLHLLPLSLTELPEKEKSMSIDEHLYRGFYPRVHNDDLDPTKAYRNYFENYVERDVRQLINVKDLNLFIRFIKLCAGRIGQVLNKHSLANELGISSHTVTEWISTLEASFLIVQLQPYFENFGKRIIKSPKLYFVDVGLAAHLLDIENPSQLSRDPLRGQLYENMVVLELMKSRLNRGLESRLYFYRDSMQREIDLIYKSGTALLPIELKSSLTLHTGFTKQLEFFENLVGDRCIKGKVIYGGTDQVRINGFEAIGFRDAEEAIE